MPLMVGALPARRTYATEAGEFIIGLHESGMVGVGPNKSAEQKDLVIIGGGVAGYVAAIKGAQEGLKVR